MNYLKTYENYNSLNPEDLVIGEIYNGIKIWNKHYLTKIVYIGEINDEYSFFSLDYNLFYKLTKSEIRVLMDENKDIISYLDENIEKSPKILKDLKEYNGPSKNLAKNLYEKIIQNKELMKKVQEYLDMKQLGLV